MADIYPVRAPGEYAGMICQITSHTGVKCPNYARFSITPYGANGNNRQLCCGHHAAVVLKGMIYMHERALMVQEIPGNWLKGGNEMAAFEDGIIRYVQMDRKPAKAA